MQPKAGYDEMAVPCQEPERSGLVDGEGTTDKAGEVALEERLERLRKALKQIRDGFDGDEFQDTADAYDQHREIARAALEKDDNER